MIRTGILIALAAASVLSCVLCVISCFAQLVVPAMFSTRPSPGWRVATVADRDNVGVFVEYAAETEYMEDPYPCDPGMIDYPGLARRSFDMSPRGDEWLDAWIVRAYCSKYGLIQCVEPAEGGAPSFSEMVPMRQYLVTTRASAVSLFLGAYPVFTFIRRAKRRQYVQRRWFAVVGGLSVFAGGLIVTIFSGLFALALERTYGSAAAGMLIGVAIALAVPSICAIATYRVIAGPLRRASLRRAKLCLKCLYNLTGNESGICPECGTEVIRRDS